ncbi:MAG: response regulator transcription factor [Anaerolineae bacterium]|nr:response regulator transcription factor [Anaerolineae bacterium]
MNTDCTSALIIAPPGRLRDSLQVLLQAGNEITLAGQADNARSGLQLVAESCPALVLLDTHLPGDDAWQVLENLKRNYPQIRCFVLAHKFDQERRAQEAGADAVFLAGFSAEIFFEAIKSIVSPCLSKNNIKSLTEKGE